VIDLGNKEKLFKSSDEEIATLLHSSIVDNKELKDLEIQGFVRGQKQGKTDKVSLETLCYNLEKQYRDWLVACDSKLIPKMKKTLADLRNVEGIIFLKLNEGGETKQ
jgi:hypothetical protein